MQIDLNITDHALGQINIRYPNWSKDEIVDALKNNPTFKDKDEFHTYLGTGFDIYEGNTNALRKRYQRRHLFIVSKKIKDKWYQITFVFHTNLSIVRRLEKPGVHVYNSDIRMDGDWVCTAPNVWKLLSDDPINSIRNDIQWNYADKMYITTRTIN